MWKFLVILSIFAVSQGCRVIEQKANGIESRRENHPSHVLLEVFPTFDLKYLCSGILVSDKFVLTTTSCVFGASFINAHVYANDLRDVFEDSREIYRTEQWHLHPDYDGFNYLNDVALVELPVTLNIAAKPYAIARIPIATDQLAVGRAGTTVGWGLLNFKDDNAAAFKQTQTMLVISDEDCRAAYPGKWVDDASYNGRICIRRTTGSNCVSDVGSPFMIGITVYGLQSFGQIGACDGNLPNGNQEVRYHKEWIESIIG